MSTPSVQPRKYQWFAVGDINGFFGLMFDNMTVLSFLAGILIFAFQFPADIVYKRMFPGTAFGVLFGDLVYTWMAFRLAKRTNNPTVTAMPLGLDTPSTIGIALTVLGPCFLAMKAKGMPVEDAAMMTWYVGMATMVLIGIVKVIFSFIGGWVQKIVPQAGLLGSLAGIGLALIGLAAWAAFALWRGRLERRHQRRECPGSRCHVREDDLEVALRPAQHVRQQPG